MPEFSQANSQRYGSVFVPLDRCSTLPVPPHSRLQQLISLLSSLQSLYPLRMHLFRHLLIALLLFFRSPLIFDGLYTPLTTSFQPWTRIARRSNILVFLPLSRLSFPSLLPS